MTEASLLSQIRNSGARFTVVSKRRNFLSLYFLCHPSFREAMRTEGGHWSIFERRADSDDLRPLTPDSPCLRTGFPLVDPRVDVYLDRLRADFPDQWRDLQTKYFAADLGLGQEELQRLRNIREPILTLNRSYSRADLLDLTASAPSRRAERIAVPPE